MPFKLVIGDMGKAWKLETESEFLVGKSVGENVSGKEIKPELEGYELEITGASDIAGFPHSKNVEGLGLKRLLLKKGWGMHDNRDGMRLRKTVRGKVLSASTSQVNFKIVKSGSKSLSEIFPEQKKTKAEAKAEVKPVETPAV